MQVLSCGHSYLKRDSRDSQISFCFTVFQEKSSSSKAKRVRTVILHLFSHVDSFFRPWTKRMQYPMLGKKKRKGKMYRKLYFKCLVYLQDHPVLHLLHNYWGFWTNDIFWANKLQFNSSFSQVTTQFPN